MSSYLQIQFVTRSPLLRVCSSYTYEDTKQSQTKLRSRDTVIRIKKNGSFLRTIIDRKRRDSTCCNGALFPVDPWAPNVDSQSIASQLFAFSLFPYLGFLYFITKSKTAPRLTLFGFYFLLAFVGATIPAGIYAKVRYGTSLSNVDWLHGGAESLLTLTNIFIVLGLRGALRKPSDGNENASDFTAEANKEENPSI